MVCGNVQVIGTLLLWFPITMYRCFRYVHDVRIMSSKRPLVVVHGDTLSTWLGALAGRWGDGIIVHLESGLSSGRWFDPFPEELLRRWTFGLASYALCPNDAATARMNKYPDCVVVNTHENTLLDCVRYTLHDRTVAPADKTGFVFSIHRFQQHISPSEIATHSGRNNIHCSSRLGIVYSAPTDRTQTEKVRFPQYVEKHSRCPTSATNAIFRFPGLDERCTSRIQ